MIYIDTKIPDDYNDEIEAYDIKMRLLPYYKEFNDRYEILDSPILKLNFVDSLKSFEYDAQYNREFQSMYNSLRNTIEGRVIMIQQNFLKDDKEDKLDYLSEKYTAYKQEVKDRIQRIYKVDEAEYQKKLEETKRKTPSEEKITAKEKPKKPIQEPQDSSSKEDTSNALTSNIPQPIKRDVVDEATRLAALEAERIRLDSIKEKNRLDSLAELYKNDQTVLINRDISDSLKIDSSNTLHMEILSEAKDSSTSTSAAINQEKAQEIKLSTEFVEMTDNKRKNNIELNKINQEENASRESYLANQVERAKNKRKLLEIIAEAKTDLKKQALIQPNNE